MRPLWAARRVFVHFAADAWAASLELKLVFMQLAGMIQCVVSMEIAWYVLARNPYEQLLLL